MFTIHEYCSSVLFTRRQSSSQFLLIVINIGFIIERMNFVQQFHYIKKKKNGDL